MALAALAARSRRRRGTPVLALALGAAAILGLACSSDLVPPSTNDAAAGSDAGDASPAETSAGAPFGATCAADDDCASGLCATFGDASKHCSVACTDSASCPEGTQGRKCSGKGFCAY
jgi:hypothetical protein